MLPSNVNLRPATTDDRSALSSLLNFEYYIHRHLDWRPALDWLGSRPFWVLERQNRLLAALACPPDPPEVAWVRLFVNNTYLRVEEAWRFLFSAAYKELSQISYNQMAALALHEWFARLLQQNGFEFLQDIIVLEWNRCIPSVIPLPGNLLINEMQSEDLPEVQVVDNLSFDPLWRISLDSLRRSYNQSTYATVAVFDGRIVGYQISTDAPSGAHLARLAVRPDFQRQYIGYGLVLDLQNYFLQRRADRITVNTQCDNHASLALYEKLNFKRTGERFPVFIYPR